MALRERSDEASDKEEPHEPGPYTPPVEGEEWSTGIMLMEAGNYEASITMDEDSCIPEEEWR